MEKERKYSQEEYKRMIADAEIPADLLGEDGLPLPYNDCIYDSFDMGLERFIRAQDTYDSYLQALAEVKAGRKRSHWIWYILPQLIGLGFSEMSTFFGIKGTQEAVAYMQHPVLRDRLVEVATAALESTNTIRQIFGGDAIKVRSCITLFASVSNEPVFKKLIEKEGWDSEDK